MKLFETRVSSFTVVIKSCIFDEAVLKMNDYLTYFEAKSSNTQFLCHFDFTFFKFSIIPSPSCNSFKCARMQQEAELHFFEILQSCFLRLTYPQTVLFLSREGSSNGVLESFWHNVHLPQSIFLVQSETVAYFCYH